MLYIWTCPKLLLYKLDDFGLSDGLILLIESYLRERVQFVQYRGFRSESFSQTSGVPQSSVLGPLFFNIFINDLTSLLNENFQMYADDLKIYRTVSTLNVLGCRKILTSFKNGAMTMIS
jgi:ribonuclease P/MRP protein subunit RPP40